MALLSDQEIISRIKELCKERNAVILAHNYELGEIQDLADFAGDSLELSFKAQNIEAEVIVFCGVTFMAETAYILSPEKTVLLPVLQAGCAMADMAEAGELKKLKVEHPDALVACYVNSTAAIKAESDICVTSSNALQVIRSLPEDKKIIFVPDKNLGTYIQSQTGRDMIMWDGYCPVHMRISPQDILKRKEEFPGAKVMIHPESTMEAIALADEVLSTGGMCKFAKETDEKVLIAATEIGLLHRLRKENPDKQFVPISEQAVCPTMKMIRLVDVLNCLEKMEHKITVPNNIIDQARLPITRMLDASKSLLKK